MRQNTTQSGKILRIDADKIVRLATLTGERRFEIELKDSQGKNHVVSLPLPEAVDLACMICDASDAAPYLVGGVKRSKT